MNLHPYIRNPVKGSLAKMVLKRDCGDVGFCQLCGPASSQREDFLELDHIDGNPADWEPSNLRLLCKPHNLGERNRQHYVKVERENLPPVFPPRYSAQEGEDHASMRKNWDDWIRGKRKDTFPLLADLKAGRLEWYKAADVALRAPSACRDETDEVPHSSKTFRVYLEEDIAEGIFESDIRKNALWIRYSGSSIEMLMEMGAVKIPQKVG